MFQNISPRKSGAMLNSASNTPSAFVARAQENNATIPSNHSSANAPVKFAGAALEYFVGKKPANKENKTPVNCASKTPGFSECKNLETCAVKRQGISMDKTSAHFSPKRLAKSSDMTPPNSASYTASLSSSPSLLQNEFIDGRYHAMLNTNTLPTPDSVLHKAEFYSSNGSSGVENIGVNPNNTIPNTNSHLTDEDDWAIAIEFLCDEMESNPSHINDIVEKEHSSDDFDSFPEKKLELGTNTEGPNTSSPGPSANSQGPSANSQGPSTNTEKTLQLEPNTSLTQGDIELRFENRILPCPSQLGKGLEVPDMFGKVLEKLSSLPRWKFDRNEVSNNSAKYLASLSFKHWNTYLRKIGFRSSQTKKVLKLDETIVVKAGLVRCWISVSANAGYKTLLEAEKRMGKAFPIFLSPEELDFLTLSHSLGHTIIFPITREFICSIWMTNYYPKGTNDKFPTQKIRNVPGMNHMGILIVKENHWRYMDCENHPGNKKTWVNRYYREVKRNFVLRLAFKLNCRVDTLEFVPTWDSHSFQQSSYLYCLFAVEQIQKNHPNFVLNKTVSQSIIYFEKVKHILGGNPFPYEWFLQTVADGNGSIDFKVEEVQAAIEQSPDDRIVSIAPTNMKSSSEDESTDEDSGIDSNIE